MTSDLSALSRGDLTERILVATTHEFYIPLRDEILRRLRADGARIAELEMSLRGASATADGFNQRAQAAEARCRGLESQLAANGKTDAGIAVASEQIAAVYGRGRDTTPLSEPVEPDDLERRLARWRDWAVSCALSSDELGDDELMDRIGDRVSDSCRRGDSKPDADGTLHDRIGPTSGRLLSASPIVRKSGEAVADGKGVRRYGGNALVHSKTLDEAILTCDRLGLKLAGDLAAHLQSVLAGVERVAAEMERVPLGSGGLQAYVWAAKLREVIRG